MQIWKLTQTQNFLGLVNLLIFYFLELRVIMLILTFLVHGQVSFLLDGSAIKLAATYNALEGTDADFLARPTYKMTTKNYILFSTMEATVEGYKGKY